MKRFMSVVFMLLLAASARAEIQTINITIFGMD
jgi:hypothetical protein